MPTLLAVPLSGPAKREINALRAINGRFLWQRVNFALISVWGQLRRQIIAALVLLIPLTLAPTLVHMTGTLYFVAALFLGAAFLYFGVQICREYTYARARQLLLASVIYIPLLFGSLVVDKLISLSPK